MRRQKQFHYIYKITRFDGKYYIGLHSTNNLDDGYFGSGKYLRNSINYHGIEKHTKEIIEFLPDRQSLKDRERELVNEECISDPLCMNLKKGGEGGFDHLNEGGISFHKNKRVSDPNWNRSISPFTKDRSTWTEEFKQKQIEGCRKGGKTNIQYRMECIKRIYPDGTRKGYKNTDEHNRKIGKANSINQQGERNSQYGTCWITKDSINKKIKKEDLDSWLEQGWVKGRKC